MDRELIDYLPDFLKQFREFKQLMYTEQPQMEKLWNYIDDTLANFFISDATNDGLKRFETILSIKPKDTDSLSDRRFRILSRWNEQLPYTMNVLKMQLTSLCGTNGYLVELNNREYTLVVKVALTAKNNFIDVGNYLEKVVPVNMVIDLSLLYNQHQTLAKYMHTQLSIYTQQQLRDEVMK